MAAEVIARVSGINAMVAEVPIAKVSGTVAVFATIATTGIAAVISIATDAIPIVVAM
ncbi:MAG: hypothetical protein DHS20C06_14170 [Hyphobacterium sp.]|nr:MAG: hypothetical protein DHS20C06_14170 [Hyphobacterium sp.]